MCLPSDHSIKQFCKWEGKKVSKWLMLSLKSKVFSRQINLSKITQLVGKVQFKVMKVGLIIS